MADKSKLLKEFREITGAEEDIAEKVLQTSSWNIQDALAEYYDAVSSLDESTDSEDIHKKDSVSHGEKIKNEKGEGSSVGTPKRKRIKDNIASLRTLSEPDSDEERQAFYTGGETSGQQVLGPNKNRDESGTDNELNRLLKRAQERARPPPEPKTAFSGTGYRLGQANDDPIVVIDNDEDDDDVAIDDSNSASSEVLLELWQGGFCVDNGPLREYSDPGNWEFLQTVMRGSIPPELRAGARRGEVKIAVKDKRHKKYIKPDVKVKAFSGTGHMLGSPAPHFVSSPSHSSEEEESDVKVDEGAPQTTIQVRLADGTCTKFKLNHSHKIKDLKKLIVESRPQYKNKKFSLCTSFPRKELSNAELTLEEAGILSSTVLQNIN